MRKESTYIHWQEAARGETGVVRLGWAPAARPFEIFSSLGDENIRKVYSSCKETRRKAGPSAGEGGGVAQNRSSDLCVTDTIEEVLRVITE